MSPESAASLTAVVAFIGVILTPIISGVLARKNEIRKERHDYVLSRVTALIEIRADLQFYQLGELRFKNIESILKNMDWEKSAEYTIYLKSQVLFGKAYGIMLATDIREIKEKAPILMNAPINPEITTQKLAAIDFAINRLVKEYGYKFEEINL